MILWQQNRDHLVVETAEALSQDEFNPNEGFTGTEDTLSRIVFGVTS